MKCLITLDDAVAALHAQLNAPSRRFAALKLLVKYLHSMLRAVSYHCFYATTLDSMQLHPR